MIIMIFNVKIVRFIDWYIAFKRMETRLVLFYN